MKKLKKSQRLGVNIAKILRRAYEQENVTFQKDELVEILQKAHPHLKLEKIIIIVNEALSIFNATNWFGKIFPQGKLSERQAKDFFQRQENLPYIEDTLIEALSILNQERTGAVPIGEAQIFALVFDRARKKKEQEDPVQKPQTPQTHLGKARLQVLPGGKKDETNPE